MRSPFSRSMAGAHLSRTRRGRLRFGPCLDALEDRSLLSVFTVTNTGDSPTDPHSLRGAIAQATLAGGGTVDASGVTGTIRLTHGPLALTTALTITGPNSNRLAVSGNGGQAIVVSPGAMVTIAHLTIRDGSALQGGGIDNAGTLTLTQSTITDNVAQRGQGGGGVLNEVGATLNVDHSTFSNNQAIAGDSLDVFGGGLLNLGTATIDTTMFTANQALGGAGATFFGGSVGGGIDNFGGANLTVTTSTFLGNRAVGAAGPYFGMGGAIESNSGFGGGDSTTAVPSKAVIRDSTFIANVATALDGGTGNGGAIMNQGFDTDMLLTNSTLKNNLALGGAGVDKIGQLSQALGGGALNALGSTLTVSGCLLTGNQAIGGSGGTPNTEPPGFGPATGAAFGGGILTGFAMLTVCDSTLVGNQAIGGTTKIGAGGNAHGGGIDVFGPGGNLKLVNSALVNNLAIAGSGGTVASGEQIILGVALGAGLDIAEFGAATVTDSMIVGNKAIGGAGGAGITGGPALGGGIAVGGNILFPNAGGDGSSLTITGSKVSGNLAQGGAGGLGAAGGVGWGGGIIVFGSSTATLNDDSLDGNRAVGGRGGAGASDGAGVGGGLYIAPDATVKKNEGTKILGNSASTSDNNIFDGGTLITS